LVYKATHLDLQRTVAIKILLTNLSSNPQAMTRFRAEGITTSKVTHPNAISVSDFGVTDDGVAFLVMEILEGHSLDTELEREVNFSMARGVEILAPACDALFFAHQQGIVHRDVKPSNIFLHQSPTGEIIKVLDFGLAKFAGEDLLQGQKTADGYVLGTMSYMAPERLKNHPYDGGVDVYGVGCILYEMFCGRLPFVSLDSEPFTLALMHLNETPVRARELNPEISPELDNLIMETLSKTPSARPSAKVLADRLRALLKSTKAQDPLIRNPTLLNDSSDYNLNPPESSLEFALLQTLGSVEATLEHDAQNLFLDHKTDVLVEDSE
jgi:eukaryotic-like serine/threonine-protein kinase